MLFIKVFTFSVLNFNVIRTFFFIENSKYHEIIKIFTKFKLPNIKIYYINYSTEFLND